MKKKIKMVLLPTALLTIGMQVNAADSTEEGSSWWDTGKELLNSVSSDSQTSDSTSSLATDQIYEALKQALQVSASTVTSQLGTTGGYNDDSEIHIDLPTYLQTVRPAMEAAGAGELMDDLELKLNRAAEAAAPEAKEVFIDSIQQMTLDDARSIYEGADDAATTYFKNTMSDPLKEKMRPIVLESMSEVGLVQAYDNVMSEYSDLPFVPDVKSNLSDYVVQQGLDGLFYYMAEEEAAIRNDPTKQTTELLKKVFGSSD